jgi:uridine kinase
MVGVCGGSGSGKTTLVDAIVKSLGKDQVLVIPHDYYYRDRSDMSLAERRSVNYDHPSALETELLVQHLGRLLAGSPVELPQYDFRSHTRRSETVHAEPKRIIIVEGVLVFAEPALRQLCDIKVYVDTPDDIRFIRRLQRDTTLRGRSSESVVAQYLETTRSMHLKYVEPSKRFADIIVPDSGSNPVPVELLLARLATWTSGPTPV